MAIYYYGSSFLWLYGFAGCGKSVLCSTDIQHAFRYAFFTFNGESRQDISALLRALLLQLSAQVTGFDADLTRLKETYHHSTPQVPMLTEHLRQAVNRCRHVYLLLDALDEQDWPKCGQGLGSERARQTAMDTSSSRGRDDQARQRR